MSQLIRTIDHLSWKSGNIAGITTIHELCDEDLGAWLRRTPIKSRNCHLMKQWLKDILGALDYLHTVRRVAHLDIKPQNILIKDGRCKVSDYGLCRLLGDGRNGVGITGESNADCSVTVDMSDEAEWCGTVVYQPPEHLLGLIDRSHALSITPKVGRSSHIASPLAAESANVNRYSVV